MSDSILLSFGQRVRELRQRNGWSQELLAKKTGLHRTYIGGIERGERNVCLENIEKIAVAFDISLSQLFEQSG